jgi:predicted Zn-dependent protease
LLGYTTEPLWAQYQSSLNAAISSFRRLTDQKVLQIQPMKLKIITASGRTTLAGLATQSGSPVTLQTLAIINQTTENATIAKGERVKMVVGTKPPGE